MTSTSLAAACSLLLVVHALTPSSTAKAPRIYSDTNGDVVVATVPLPPEVAVESMQRWSLPGRPTHSLVLDCQGRLLDLPLGFATLAGARRRRTAGVIALAPETWVRSVFAGIEGAGLVSVCDPNPRGCATIVIDRENPGASAAGSAQDPLRGRAGSSMRFSATSAVAAAEARSQDQVAADAAAALGMDAAEVAAMCAALGDSDCPVRPAAAAALPTTGAGSFVPGGIGPFGFDISSMAGASPLAACAPFARLPPTLINPPPQAWSSAPSCMESWARRSSSSCRPSSRR